MADFDRTTKNEADTGNRSTRDPALFFVYFFEQAEKGNLSECLIQKVTQRLGAAARNPQDSELQTGIKNLSREQVKIAVLNSIAATERCNNPVYALLGQTFFQISLIMQTNAPNAAQSQLHVFTTKLKPDTPDPLAEIEAFLEGNYKFAAQLALTRIESICRNSTMSETIGIEALVTSAKNCGELSKPQAKLFIGLMCLLRNQIIHERKLTQPAQTLESGVYGELAYILGEYSTCLSPEGFLENANNPLLFCYDKNFGLVGDLRYLDPRVRNTLLEDYFSLDAQELRKLEDAGKLGHLEALRETPELWQNAAASFVLNNDTQLRQSQEKKTALELIALLKDEVRGFLLGAGIELRARENSFSAFKKKAAHLFSESNQFSGLCAILNNLPHLAENLDKKQVLFELLFIAHTTSLVVKVLTQKSNSAPNIQDNPEEWKDAPLRPKHIAELCLSLSNGIERRVTRIYAAQACHEEKLRSTTGNRQSPEANTLQALFSLSVSNKKLSEAGIPTEDLPKVFSFIQALKYSLRGVFIHDLRFLPDPLSMAEKLQVASIIHSTLSYLEHQEPSFPERKNLSLKDLAEIASFHPRTFQMVFKALFSSSPQTNLRDAEDVLVQHIERRTNLTQSGDLLFIQRERAAKDLHLAHARAMSIAEGFMAYHRSRLLPASDTTAGLLTRAAISSTIEHLIDPYQSGTRLAPELWRAFFPKLDLAEKLGEKNSERESGRENIPAQNDHIPPLPQL